MTTFRPPCGCLLEMTEGELPSGEPCPIHQVEGLTPMEVMAMYLRVVLMEETEEQALAVIRGTQKRSSANG